MPGLTDQLLGKPGAGMAIFNHSMRWERSCILASTLETMRNLDADLPENFESVAAVARFSDSKRVLQP